MDLQVPSRLNLSGQDRLTALRCVGKGSKHPITTSFKYILLLPAIRTLVIGLQSVNSNSSLSLKEETYELGIIIGTSPPKKTL